MRGGLRREASTAEAKISTAALANSDGWIEIGPTKIQRWAPLMLTPIPGILTATSRAIEANRIGAAK